MPNDEDAPPHKPLTPEQQALHGKLDKLSGVTLHHVNVDDPDRFMEKLKAGAAAIERTGKDPIGHPFQPYSVPHLAEVCCACGDYHDERRSKLPASEFVSVADRLADERTAQRSTPLEGAQFSPTLDRMMSAEIAAANAHLDAKEAKIDAHGYTGAERVVPVGLHPFIPHSDPTTNAIARMTVQRDEARAMKDVAEREMIAYRDKCSKLEERIERFEKSVSPSDEMRARVYKADDENRRLGEIVDEQAEHISKLEAQIEIATKARGKDPVAMRRALVEATDKLAAPYHEEVQRLRAGIVEISKERDTLADELKQRRYETAEIRDALVVYVLRYLKHKGESDAMALRLAKLAAQHALCNHAKPPESVHPSHLSTVIETLEDEIKRLTECLAIADADRVPLQMDLDEAKKTIVRMQSLCNAAQLFATYLSVHDHAVNETHDCVAFQAAAEAYEKACAQAANAEEIETGISSPDDDIPF